MYSAASDSNLLYHHTLPPRRGRVVHLRDETIDVSNAVTGERGEGARERESERARGIPKPRRTLITSSLRRFPMLTRGRGASALSSLISTAGPCTMALSYGHPDEEGSGRNEGSDYPDYPDYRSRETTLAGKVSGTAQRSSDGTEGAEDTGQVWQFDGSVGAVLPVDA